MRYIILIILMLGFTQAGAQTAADTLQQRMYDSIYIKGQTPRGISPLNLTNRLQEIITLSTRPANIVQNSSYRFITDAERTLWNATSAGYVPNTRTVNGYPLSSNIVLGKADVNLGNADNTSDANKPVSTATQAALNRKHSRGGDATTGPDTLGTTNAQPVVIIADGTQRDSISPAAAGNRYMTTNMLTVNGTRPIQINPAGGSINFTNLVNAEPGIIYTNSLGSVLSKDGVTVSSGNLSFRFYGSPGAGNLGTIWLYPQTTPGPKLAITANGSVLVGTTAPTYGVLQVNGTASISGITLFNTTTSNNRDQVQINGSILGNALYLPPITEPSTPSTGGVLWVETGGVLKFKKSTGAVTTIVP